MTNERQAQHDVGPHLHWSLCTGQARQKYAIEMCSRQRRGRAAAGRAFCGDQDGAGLLRGGGAAVRVAPGDDRGAAGRPAPALQRLHVSAQYPLVVIDPVHLCGRALWHAGRQHQQAAFKVA